MDDRLTFLPPALARLVETQSSSNDLAAEIAAHLSSGRLRVTLGLGHEADVPLLPEELVSIEPSLRDRSMVVAAIRVDHEGYAVERPATNFGVYVRRDTVWRSVPQAGELRGLQPGAEIGLGSTPAEAVRLTLPPGPWIATSAYRSARHRVIDEGRAAPPSTPPTAGPRLRRPTTTPHTPGGVDRQRTPPTLQPRSQRVGPDRRYEARFALALQHWRYAMITFGGDPRAVLHLEDPALSKLRAAIARNVDAPDRGYELFVKDPTPDLWLAGPGEMPRQLKRGQAIRIHGGSTIGFGIFAVTLPEPAEVTPRFGPGSPPTTADVAAVFELSVLELRDEERVKTRYRELARRFHPDRTNNDPGPTSRFVELQQAFEAWKSGLPGAS
ncbi:MAG: DnaJ domain-containing protein [Myxococcales bacterium]|nr:DnaJ domain-containing protein [Myxococcales bacterium]